MPESFRPAMSRRIIRTTLRNLRSTADETQKQLADALGWSTAKVIRIEGGKTQVAVSDLRAILSHYGIHDEQEIQRLEKIARAAREPTLATKHGAAISKSFAEFLDHEEAARTIRQWEPTLIPGLLQTKEYARAALNNFEEYSRAAIRNHVPTDIEARVQLRLERKSLLMQDDGPLAMFIIDESALLRQIGVENGSDGIMEGQLAHLKEMNELPNVIIQVMPLSAGAFPPMRGPFVILEFDDAGSLLYIEHPEGGIIDHDDAPQIASYLEFYAAMERVATPPEAFGRIADRLVRQPGFVM